MRGGCETMHVQRALLERMTGTGWSLGRLADRVLRTPARFTVSGRRIKMTTGGASGALALARLRACDPARALRLAGRPDPKRHGYCYQGAKTSLRTVSASIRPMRGVTPMPGPVGTAIDPFRISNSG